MKGPSFRECLGIDCIRAVIVWLLWPIATESFGIGPLSLVNACALVAVLDLLFPWFYPQRYWRPTE